MDDRYTGLEGCEDLWELLRSVYQTQGILKGWRRYFETQESGITTVKVECQRAVTASDELYNSIRNVYSIVFKSLQ